ncbi:MAG TPA: DNA alkylation repair protein [Chloroflexi bacterium]|nr:DNA alkylation repair protein [Chloroflexota bacterium]
MPAVQLSLLRSQLEELSWYFEEPEEFQRALGRLFELYSDRTYRPGQVAGSVPLSQAYHIPPLVLQQLSIAFEDLCLEKPDSALALADRLWQDPYLEVRQTAGALLGLLPAERSTDVLQRLRAWSQPEEEKVLVQYLLDQGSRRVRQQHTGEYIDLIRDWLSGKPAYQAFGLRALLPLVEDHHFENIPLVFTLISPLIAENPGPVQNELLAILQALSRRVPVEAGFFLSQMVTLNRNQVVQRLARRCLPLLTPRAQENLRPLLSNHPR